jgi:ubiquitin-conjugating enzyme E2 J2
MASIIQKKRLANEVKLLQQQPLHYCTAYPDEENPLIWYFLIVGQKGTDYHNGEYIGKIVHSPKYPAEPPDYYMLTPSGRYNINAKICLTNSSYHKGDWSSTWNILSILIAFYSIWLDDKEHGISHITDTSANRKKMAKESIEYNKKNNAKIYQKFDRTYLSDDAPVQLMKKKEETVAPAPEPAPEPINLKEEAVQVKEEAVQVKEEVVQVKEEIVAPIDLNMEKAEPEPEPDVETVFKVVKSAKTKKIKK